MLALLAFACGQGKDARALSLATVADHTATAGRYRFSIVQDLGEQRLTFTGVVDLSAKATESTFSFTEGTATEVTSDRDIYVSASKQMRVPGGKHWLHERLPANARTQSSDLTSAIAGSLTGGGSPVSFVSRLRAAGITMHPAGSTHVRGVTVTHYAVALLQSFVFRCGTSARTIAADVYVDGQQRLRRFHMRVAPTDVPPAHIHAEETVGGDLTLDLYDFGSAPPVTIPPANEVAEGPTFPDLGAQPPVSCVPTTTTTVRLPPADPRHRSTLQFPPIVAIQPGTDCSAQPPNPPPAQPVTLPDPHTRGLCYELAPAALVIEHMHTSVQTDESTGQILLAFTLPPGTTEPFDRMAAANIGKQVAVVAFGTVLSAPTFQTDHFGGKGQVTGITPQEAADLHASLS